MTRIARATAISIGALVACSLAGGCHKKSNQSNEGPSGFATAKGNVISGTIIQQGDKTRMIADPTAAPSASAAPASSAPSMADILTPEKVAGVVNPSSMPIYSGPTGSVEGDVWVVGPDAPSIPDLDFSACPGARDVFGKLFRAGASVGTLNGQPKRPLADAVVAVTEYKGFVAAQGKSKSFIIGEHCEVPSKTVTLTFGQYVDVGNMSHELFGPSLSGVDTAAVRVAPPQQKGEPVQLVPPHPGFYTAKDIFHTFFHLDVYVLPTPLHTVSDKLGHFRIDGVPVGTAKVNARLAAIARTSGPAPGAAPDARIGEITEPIEVKAGQIVHANLIITYSPDTAPKAASSRPPMP